jgi:hypothetical protein
VRLEGSLDAFSLPDIFSLLSMTKKTGGLHLRRPTGHGVVWLGDGLIRGGAADLSRMSLGRRLAASGRVSDADLRAAANQVRDSDDIGLARALREAGAIDDGDLHNLISEHVVDTVFDLMRWTDGVFEFVVDEPNHDDVGVARDVDEVVGEARRRLDAWNAIDPRIADPDTVLSLALHPDAEPAVGRDEWSLLALVDGHRTIGDLVAICGKGDYAVVVALADLVGRGLLQADPGNGVVALLERQAVIAELEAACAPAPSNVVEALNVVVADPAPESLVPSAPAVERPDPGPVVASVAPIAETDADEAADEAADDGDWQPLQPVATLADEAQPEADDPSGGLADVASIARAAAAEPEPIVAASVDSGFQPSPEPLAAAAGGGVVAAPVPAGVIERDPSVNKSLLLRLIAGVRGL